MDEKFFQFFLLSANVQENASIRDGDNALLGKRLMEISMTSQCKIPLASKVCNKTNVIYWHHLSRIPLNREYIHQERTLHKLANYLQF